MQPKTETMRLRISPLEKRLYQANAEACNLPLSTYVRLMLGFAVTRGGNAVLAEMKAKRR
jgi:hypothetical protein